MQRDIKPTQIHRQYLLPCLLRTENPTQRANRLRSACLIALSPALLDTTTPSESPATPCGLGLRGDGCVDGIWVMEREGAGVMVDMERRSAAARKQSCDVIG